jgi:hypothetical protein
MNNTEPVFQFLRATPSDLAGNPPLASSLQAFETSLELLALGRDQYPDQQPTKQIDPTWYFAPLTAQLRHGFRLAWTSQAEYQALEAYESNGGLYEEHEAVKRQIRGQLGDSHVTCCCPICDAHEVLIVEFNNEAMNAGRLEAERCFCVGCHFHLPKEAGFLIQLLAGKELRDKWDTLRADCGLIS